MTRPGDAELADAWVAHWRHYEATGEFAQDSAGPWVDLPQVDPEKCWRVIGHVLDKIDADPENPLFGVLAAGPLEHVLDHWGPELIDRVEAKAAQDSRFKLLLGGVWRSTIDPEVWARVEACRIQPW